MFYSEGLGAMMFILVHTGHSQITQKLFPMYLNAEFGKYKRLLNSK
jgi:hypothetical protein